MVLGIKKPLVCHKKFDVYNIYITITIWMKSLSFCRNYAELDKTYKNYTETIQNYTELYTDYTELYKNYTESLKANLKLEK